MLLYTSDKNLPDSSIEVQIELGIYCNGQMSYVCMGILPRKKKSLLNIYENLFFSFGLQTAQFKLNSSHKKDRVIVGNFLRC